jgi:hypothetical protein
VLVVFRACCVLRGLGESGDTLWITELLRVYLLWFGWLRVLLGMNFCCSWNILGVMYLPDGFTLSVNKRTVVMSAKTCNM